MKTDEALGALTRRAFMQGTVSGTLLTGVAALLPVACSAYAPAAPETFTVLDAKTAAIVEAIADAMIDDGTGRLPVPSKAGIAKRVDVMLAGLHEDTVRQSLLLFNVVEHATLPFGLYFNRFTKLSRAEQQAYLAGWAGSSLGFRRMAAQALKMFVYVNYYGIPGTWAHLGYDGPWIGRFEMPYYEPPLAKYTAKEPL
jgi:hypothetical protein